MPASILNCLLQQATNHGANQLSFQVPVLGSFIIYQRFNKECFTTRPLSPVKSFFRADRFYQGTLLDHFSVYRRSTNNLNQSQNKRNLLACLSSTDHVAVNNKHQRSRRSYFIYHSSHAFGAHKNLTNLFYFIQLSINFPPIFVMFYSVIFVISYLAINKFPPILSCFIQFSIIVHHFVSCIFCHVSVNTTHCTHINV